MNEFIEKLIGRLEEKKSEHLHDEEVTQGLGKINLASFCSAKARALDGAIEIVNQLAEEYNNGWITDRVPTKEECGAYGRAWFLTTIPQHDGDRTVPMQYEYTTVRGKEVSRWMWYGRIANVKVIAWRPLPSPYQPKGE